MTRRFEPTQSQRDEVRKLSGFGLPHALLATIVGVSVKTLERAFATELTEGRAQAAGKILECLYLKALAGDTIAMLFWIKCRLQWREASRVELTGADGAPIAQPPHGVMIVPAPESAEAWEKRVAREQAALIERYPPRAQTVQ